MQGSATEKVPGGKLVRVKVEYAHSINDVKITGDFFMHPEEGVHKIEARLRGLDRHAEQEDIERRVREAVTENRIHLLGVTEDAIARLVKEALK